MEEHRVLARQFGLQKEWGTAITHYEALLKIKEKDKSALLNLIQCYDSVDKNDNDKLKIRLRIEELVPKDDENLYEIALIYDSNKKYKSALKYINKAIKINDTISSYYNVRGNIKDDLEDYNGALLDYEQAIILDDTVASYYYNRGIVKNNLKDYEGALLDYDKAIALNNKPNYYYNKASVYRKLKLFDKAHEFCDIAIELGAEDGRDIGTKAAIYASEGNDELFYEYLEKAFQQKAKAIWLDDDIQEKYKNEKRFQELLAKYDQTLEDED